MIPPTRSHSAQCSAVIGGLIMATMTTLFIVPIVYSLLRKNPPVDFERRIVEEEHAFLRENQI